MLVTDVIDVENILYVEKRLGLPDGFIEALSSESDWGYIVKSHALYESLFSSLLCVAFDNSNLEKSLLKLPMNGKCSKVSFLSSLDLISTEHKDKIFPFINSLSQIRNYIVHDASNLNFNIQDYFDTLKPSDRKKLSQSLLFYSKGLTNKISLVDCEAEKGKWDLILYSNVRLWFEITNQVVFQIVSLYVQVEELKVEKHNFERERLA
ncbi:TPA: hypothetical protein ACMDR5_003552 [Vibrio cholerae]|uniref:hypothetical protein n=1 Tax=Vibrio cholerae TaxID=666 RepID=UPI002934655B|nr:hypothetical protein [Vibrio cholerae]MDV2395292.1 hypothetical protein [Vibrio cholerae]